MSIRSFLLILPSLPGPHRRHGQTRRSSRPILRRRRPRCRRRRAARRRAAVVRHVRPNQVAGREGAAQAQLPGQHCCRNYAGQHAGVVAWASWVRAADSEEVQHGRLGLQDRATPYRADFDAWHGHGDLKVAVIAGQC
jgi:hypothetical protein